MTNKWNRKNLRYLAINAWLRQRYGVNGLARAGVDDRYIQLSEAFWKRMNKAAA